MNGPLSGKRILVTRTRGQSSDLARLIDELGGEALEFPVIRMQEPADRDTVRKLNEALCRLESYDWVLFTSVNGVEFFFRKLYELRSDIRKLQRARIAAVGPKTAEALLARGVVAEIIPAKFQGDELFAAIRPELRHGDHVLLPRADIARKYIPDKLREAGMQVTEAQLYENVPDTENAKALLEHLRSQHIHMITFTSSSTVKNLFSILLDVGVKEPLQLLKGIQIACIGPLTAQTAIEQGLTVDYLAEEATIEALVRAMIDD